QLAVLLPEAVLLTPRVEGGEDEVVRRGQLPEVHGEIDRRNHGEVRQAPEHSGRPGVGVGRGQWAVEGPRLAQPQPAAGGGLLFLSERHAARREAVLEVLRERRRTGQRGRLDLLRECDIGHARGLEVLAREGSRERREREREGPALL